jgi:hypothetical protein
MSNKYHTRSGFMVSRDTDAVERPEKQPSWFNDFISNLEKEAVKSKKEDYSLYQQINDVISGKSKYSNVEEAVKDMAKRTGLSDMLNKKEAQEKKKVFDEIPELKIFVDNYVEDRPGTSVDAVIHDLVKIRSIKEKLPENGDVPEEIKLYINDKIKERENKSHSKDHNDLQLGKIDLSVDDGVGNTNNPFQGCEPNRK